MRTRQLLQNIKDLSAEDFAVVKYVFNFIPRDLDLKNSQLNHEARDNLVMSMLPRKVTAILWAVGDIDITKVRSEQLDGNLLSSDVFARLNILLKILQDNDCLPDKHDSFNSLILLMQKKQINASNENLVPPAPALSKAHLFEKEVANPNIKPSTQSNQQPGPTSNQHDDDEQPEWSLYYDSLEHMDFCKKWNVTGELDEYGSWLKFVANFARDLEEKNFQKLVVSINLLPKDICTEKNLHSLFSDYLHKHEDVAILLHDDIVNKIIKKVFSSYDESLWRELGVKLAENAAGKNVAGYNIRERPVDGAGGSDANESAQQTFEAEVDSINVAGKNVAGYNIRERPVDGAGERDANESAQQTFEAEVDSMKGSDAFKVNLLIAECDAYRKYLEEEIKENLVKETKGLSLVEYDKQNKGDDELWKKFSANPREDEAIFEKISDSTKIAWDKYEAMGDVRNKLTQKDKLLTQKLGDAKNELKAKMSILEQQRDSVGVTILKVFATILSLGVLAPVFWGSHGKDVAERMMDRIDKPGKKPRN